MSAVGLRTRRRRQWAAVVVVVVVVVVVLVAVVALGAAPRLVGWVVPARDLAGTGTGVGAAGGRPAAEVRWVAPVTGWPSALAADAAGAVVIAGGGEVRALDRDGTSRWRVEVPGAALHPPALDGRTVVVGAGDRVVALDRARGALRWEVAVAGGGAGPVALAGGLALYGTETGAVEAIDAGTGESRWSVAHGGAVRSAPAPGGDTEHTVVVSWHAGDESRLRALDVDTGAIRWEAPLARSAGGPAVHRGLAIVGEGDGYGTARVVARHLADGTAAWTLPVPASFESGTTPGAAGADVAVVDHFGGLTVIDARTGGLRHRIELDAPVLHTTIVMTATSVVLTTYGGELVVVDRRSGRVRHRGDPGGFPVALARAGPDLLVALRLTDPGRVEALALG